MEDDRPLLDAMKANRYAIGGPEFIEQTERQLQGRRSGRAQDADVALPRWTVDIQQIDRLVAAQYGVEPDDLKAHGRRSGPAKPYRHRVGLSSDGLDPTGDWALLWWDQLCGHQRRAPEDPQLPSHQTKTTGQLQANLSNHLTKVKS